MAEDSGDKLSLSIIFTGDFTQLSGVVDALKTKLQELNNVIKSQNAALADSSKKIDEPAQKMKKSVEDLGKSTEDLKKKTADLAKAQGETAEAGKKFADVSKAQSAQLDAQSTAISKAVGNSARYQEALAKISAQHEVGTVRYNQLKSALDKAERSILQTSSSMFRSKTAADDWANSIDRTKVMNSFLNGELVKLNGQLLSSSKSTAELARTQKELASQYDYLGAEGRRHIGMLGTQYKSVESLKTSLNGLRDSFLQSNSATVAAQAAIKNTATWMNQLGQNGTAWAKSVDVARVANAFLKDEVIKVNGQLLSQSKTTSQLETSISKLGQRYSELGNVEKYVGDRLGTSIKTMGQMEAALKSASDRMKEKTSSGERLDRQINQLQSSFGKFSGATEYMINKLKAGNITFNEAVNVMTKFKQGMAAQTETEKFNTNLMKLQAQADKLGPSFRTQGEAIVSSFRNQNISFAEASNSLSGFVNQQKVAEASSSKLSREIDSIRNTYRKYPEAVAEVVNAMRTQNMSYQEARTNMNMYKDMVNSVNETHKKAGAQATSTGNNFKQFAATIVGGGAASNIAASYITNLAVAMRSLAAWIPAAAVIGGFIASIASAVNQVKEFDQALKNLKAISGGTDAEIAILGDEMLRLSNSTKYSVSEIAKGAVFIAQAGFSASETMQVLSSSVRLAQSTLSDMSESADLVTTVLRVFHKNGTEAAAVADQLAVAANKSKTDIHGLRIAFNYLGPVAYSAKMSLQDTLAAIMALSNAGIRMSTVGTSMRQVISRLENSTSALSQAIHNAGMRLEDFNLGSQGFVKVAQNMAKIIQGDAGNALRYFGERAGNAALIISNLGPHLQTLINFLQESGVAAQMAGTQMEGLDSKLKNVRNKFENLLVSFSSGAVGDVLKSLLDGLGYVVDMFTKVMDNSAAKFLFLWGTMTVAVGAFTMALKALLAVALAAWFNQSRESIAGILNAMGLVGGTVQILKTNLATFIMTLQLMIFHIKEAVTGLGLFRGALLALRAVMAFFMGSGLGVITMITGLVAGFYTLSAMSEKDTLDMEKKSIAYSTAAENAMAYMGDLNRLAAAQQAGNDISKENLALIARAKEQYPALAQAMLANIGSIDKQKEAIKSFSAEQEKMAGKYAKAAAEMLVTQAESNFKMAKYYQESIAQGRNWATVLAEAYISPIGAMKKYWDEPKKLMADFKIGVADLLSWTGMAEERSTMLMEGYVKSLNNGYRTVEKMAAVVSAASPEIRKKFIDMIPDEKIKKQVQALVASNDQLKKMYADINNTSAEGMQRKYLNMLMELSEEWADYYKQQDAAGRKVVEDYMDQLNKKMEAEKKSYDKGKISHTEYMERIKTLQDQTYAKMIEKQSAYVDQALKLSEKRYKDEQKMIQTNGEAALAMENARFKAQMGMLEASKSDRTGYLNDIRKLEEDHNKKVVDITKGTIDEEMRLFENEYTRRKALMESTNLDAASKKARLIELERWRYEETVNILKKEFDFYKKQMEDKTTEYKKYVDEVKRLEKEKADLLKQWGKEEYDLQKMSMEANRLTMTDEEKLASKRLEFQEAIKKGNEALYKAQQAQSEEARKAEYQSAKEYYDAAKGMISGLEVVRKSADNSSMMDAEATKRVRLNAISELTSAMTKWKDAQIDANDNAQKTGKANMEKTKSELEALAKSAEDVWKKMQAAQQTALSQASADIDKLKAHIRGVDWNVVINFRGKASPEAELSATIAEIKSLLQSLEDSVQDFEVVLNFVASMGGGETMPVGEAIEATKVQIAAFQGALDELAANLQIKIQFMGYGTSDTMEWLSNAYLKAESGVVWLSQRIAAISEAGVKFLIQFMGVDEGSTTYVSTMISSLIAKFEQLSAKISSLSPTYTVTTVYKTVGSPGSAAGSTSTDYSGDDGGGYDGGGGGEEFAEGGKIPGEGDSDSFTAQLTPGEFVIRKSVVNMLGEGFFHFVNNLKSFSVPKFTRTRGIPAFAGGGPARGGDHQVFTVNLAAGDTKLPLKVIGDPDSTRKMIKKLNKELSKMRLSNGQVRNF